MVLTNLLWVISAIFGTLGTLYLTLFGAGLYNSQLIRNTILEKFIDSPTRLFAAGSFFLVVSAGAYLINTITNTEPNFITIDFDEDKKVQTAAIAGYKKEIREQDKKLIKETEKYFEAGRADLQSKRYKEAITNFSKCLDAIPTLSAYLNSVPKKSLTN